MITFFEATVSQIKSITVSMKQVLLIEAWYGSHKAILAHFYFSLKKDLMREKHPNEHYVYADYNK